MGYYDIARDARAEIKKRAASDEEREVWKSRLKDLGVRVGNALIEMGDLGAARRHFETLRGAGEGDDRVLDGRLALLCLKLGNVSAARRYVEVAAAGDGEKRDVMLGPLLSMADGRYEDAVEGWRGLMEGEYAALARQNLAVCLLYLGRLDEVRQL